MAVRVRPGQGVSREGTTAHSARGGAGPAGATGATQVWSSSEHGLSQALAAQVHRCWAGAGWRNWRGRHGGLLAVAEAPPLHAPLATLRSSRPRAPACGVGRPCCSAVCLSPDLRALQRELATHAVCLNDAGFVTLIAVPAGGPGFAARPSLYLGHGLGRLQAEKHTSEIRMKQSEKSFQRRPFFRVNCC